MSLTTAEREARKLMAYASEHQHPVYVRIARQRKDFQLSRIRQDWPNGPLSESEKLMLLIIRWVRDGLDDAQIEAEIEARFKQESALHRQQNAAAGNRRERRSKPTGGITAEVSALLSKIEINGAD